MLAKLSLRNVKRSFSDYAIYFLTLTFGVSLFYAFNSIGAQQMLLDLSKTQQDILVELEKYMGFISIFISFILAFLVLYANQFLVKRRKKELGIYETLGMKKFTISRLFIMETLMIGLVSLISGLILGALLSQGFAALTSSLFDAEIMKYQFTFSTDAMVKTIAFFAIIFIVVMIFNTIVISRFTLLELLYGSKKNDRVVIRNPKITFTMFIVSTAMIIGGYFGLSKFGLTNGILYPIIFGALIVIGTFLWFYSLSSFLLEVIQKKKSVYYKNLNIFSLRQINSKINTNFFTMAIICFMLVGTVTILSTGFGYKKAMDEELKIVTPYDVSFFNYLWQENPEDKLPNPQTAEKTLKHFDLKPSDIGNYASLFFYDAGLSAAQLMEPYITEKQYKEYFGQNYSDMVFAYSQTDYEKLVKLQGEKPLPIKKGEALIFTNMKNMIPGLNSYLEKANGIEVNGKQYNFASKEVGFLSVQNSSVPHDMLMVVLPDEAVKSLGQKGELLVANYTGDKAAKDKKMTDMYHELISPGSSEKYGGNYTLPDTKSYMYESTQGYTGILIFVGIYIGIIFLVSSAAILTLQQLSEASDNISRYKILKRIGVTQKSIHKVIFQQVFIYFMLPLALAVLHSGIVISMIYKVALTTAEVSIVVPTVWTTGILLVVYGGYFLATYKGYKTIVK